MTQHLAKPVVPTDTASRKPEHPYASYKIITSYEGGSFSLSDAPAPDSEYDVDVTRKEQAHFTLSLNTYSMDDDEARSLAQAASDWFKFIGYHYLVGCNVVVVSTTNITDRTQQIVDDYECRYGFDVRLRAARGLVKRLEAIENHHVTGTINTKGEE